MTLRITTEETRALRVIGLEGRLTAAEVGELEGVVGNAFEGVFLELCHLQSVDRAGLAALRRLRAAGVSMRGAPPHLAAQILDE